MSNCLFCKIINKDIPATVVYEDEHVLVFDDINPAAPTHKLIIPKKHIATLNDLSKEDTWTIGHMIQVGQQTAKSLGHAEDGYRLVINCNEHGGQTVYHIHLHLLAGRQLDWPPG
jgi:histidine triad (HIT) family protein